MLENIYIGIIIVILVILFYCFYISWQHDVTLLEIYEHKINLIKSGVVDNSTKQYQEFMRELESDMKKHNINPNDKKALNKLMHKIMFVEIAGQSSIFKKVFNSTFYGLLQGGATGYVTGGIPGALGGALVFGTVSPIIKAYQELNPCDEGLVEGLKSKE